MLTKCIKTDWFLNYHGYGRKRLGGAQWYAHRYAWYLKHGPIPKGLFVCHKCDNPPCINVEHLFLGTQLDNMRDAARKGRMPCGKDIPTCQLTEAQVKQIRHLYDTTDLTQQQIAKQFNISQPHVSDVLRRVYWNYVR